MNDWVGGFIQGRQERRHRGLVSVAVSLLTDVSSALKTKQQEIALRPLPLN